MASPQCMSPSSEASSLNTSHLLASDNDIMPAAWTEEAELLRPFQPSSSADSDQCPLACNEDCSSLEMAEPAPTPSIPSQQYHGNLQRTPFIAADTRELVWNELERQQGICCVPLREDTKIFATTNRPRLVSWLLDVVSALGLSHETLHVAVSILDRFIAATENPPPETMLQLLALACLSIASKHEEVVQRGSDDWMALAVDANGKPIYECGELQQMEWLVMETVDWRIRVPSTLVFLRHYQHALVHSPPGAPVVPDGARGASLFSVVATFLAELALLDDRLLKHGYSTIAVSCLVLAEMKAKETAAAAAAAAACPQPPPRVILNTLMVLTSFTGLEATQLAPGLSECLQALHAAFNQLAARGGPGGLAPSYAQMGVYAPAVTRYQRSLMLSRG